MDKKRQTRWQRLEQCRQSLTGLVLNKPPRPTRRPWIRHGVEFGNTDRTIAARRYVEYSTVHHACMRTVKMACTSKAKACQRLESLSSRRTYFLSFDLNLSLPRPGRFGGYMSCILGREKVLSEECEPATPRMSNRRGVGPNTEQINRLAEVALPRTIR
jgi:hypothetical protein